MFFCSSGKPCKNIIFFDFSRVKDLTIFSIADILNIVAHTSVCLLRLVVRTSGFHPDNSSSILLGDVNKRGYPLDTLFYFFNDFDFIKNRLSLSTLCGLGEIFFLIQGVTARGGRYVRGFASLHCSTSLRNRLSACPYQR